MSEPWWFDYVRGAEVLTPFTVSSYLITGFLLWLGWKVTKGIDHHWIRILLRAALVAIAFAPAVFTEPGGLSFVVPGSLAAIGSMILYTRAGPAADFITCHALISMFLVWCIGVAVGGLSMRMQ